MENSQYHIPVLLNETINALNIKQNGIYVDLTFGGGGHSKEILKKIKTGKLLAFDQDKDAEKNAEKILTEKENKEKFIFIRSNFIYIKNFLRYYGFNKIDGIIADLGVSSFQFDTQKRGFSYRFKGKLDMRMNENSEMKASDILNNYTEEKLYEIMKNFGEIKNPYRLVKAICKFRIKEKIEHIEQLNNIATPFSQKYNEYKFLSKVYQALRIETNNELDALKKLLVQSTNILKPKGRFAVLTYHSLEDRLVKNFIKSGNFSGKQEKDIYGNFKTYFKQINRKVIIPTENEIKNNKRSRSAKLRIAEKN